METNDRLEYRFGVLKQVFATRAEFIQKTESSSLKTEDRLVIANAIIDHIFQWEGETEHSVALIAKALVSTSRMLIDERVSTEELKTELSEALIGSLMNFADALGYGTDRLGMRSFLIDLEYGRIGATDVLKFAHYLNERGSSDKVAG